jgi:selenocysteine-specific elongation factor
MKHVIIGTAGHVDHGKTTLIQALTGTNPDRLKEEQERGMTIDIGFAALRLPDGTIAGIVDVPGHERFLKNMLAGASGVDVVLLVIAADESVMPQTVEHLDILRLLDVKNGVVALTKMDTVDREWTDAVEEDVRAQLAGSFLESAPILRVSAVTGKGVEALKKALLSAVSRAEARSTALPFRLPVDRVFTRPGFGTVVTGTLVAGTLRVGDAVEIVPQRISTRVRGLQVHGQKVNEAEAGSRVAVNIAGVETDTIQRGAQLAPPSTLQPNSSFDAVLRMLPNVPKELKDRARVRVHLGTAEILGRIRLLDDRGELPPDGRAYIQFRGEAEFACARGDRFVVRSYSPMTTIGGGFVLDAVPARHRKNDVATLASLAAKERGTPEDLLETVLQRRPAGLLQKEASAQSSLPPDDAQQALTGLCTSGKVVLLPGDRLFHADILTQLTDRARAALEAYHTQFPLRAGMPKEELRAALGRDMDNRAFASLLSHWQAQNLVVAEGATVRRTDFQVALNERQQNLLQRIEAFYRECDLATPTIEEVCAEVKAPPDAVNALLRVGVEQGRFARVADGVYYQADTLARLQQLVRVYVARHGSITVAAFRDLTNSNRKFSLQALEYFDAIRFTRRQGDERILTSP